MAPVVDGPGGFLPDTPAELRKSGDIMNGPLISGSNKEDGSLFVTFCEFLYVTLPSGISYVFTKQIRYDIMDGD